MVEPAPFTVGRTVGAAEHEQLRGDYAALKDQFEATSGVLEALGRSGADPDAVLSTIVESARRLCRSEAAHLYLLEDGVYRLMETVGLSEESRRLLTERPISRDRATLTGRVGLERRTLQIEDVLADPDYGRHDLQQTAGFRTVVAAPLVVDGQVVGALNVWRNDVRPFDDREMAIVSAFAGQAAIAVNGVMLVQQLEARSAELARKVDELEALSAVGEAVSSNLDLEKVLDTIAEHAVALSDTDGGSIMEYVERERRFFVRSVYRTAPEVVEQLRSVRIDLDTTLVGRAARERRPVVVPDLGAADLDPHLRILRDAGWLSLVAVPLLREDTIVGSLIVRRKRTGDFSPDVVDLLETFASQSALALLNAQLFRELKEQSLELEMASRHKSEFLASMSHELRTPLNAVLGFSEVLLERMFGEINERQEEYLRDIHDSGRHLLELLNEILDLSKVEAGRMELEYSSFELGALLDDAAAMLRERAGSGGIALRVEADPDLGPVYSDRLRLKQVVLNLVTNAVKFTGEGGTVAVGARRTATEVEVQVVDTGIGVPEEDRERIFESFQQGGRGASREEGTGLGLTLSRRIVELLGGRMWLESEVGVGSTFAFSLPSRTAGSETVGEQVPGVREVVVIEDDRPSLDLFTAFLDGASVRVTAARDGVAGLEAVRTRQPAAVLLDIRLPAMDGWEVLTALQEDPGTRDIPVIVVSIVDERQRGAALGAAAYLVKPVSRDALLDALERVAR
ncbi:histidine kinase [Nocardioides sp. Root1257]|uniref:hybrid sensor histidine kinase/response regulator n=1 Tax=unclassified Nocardioides TaxID=2615069 RepID=UPI0006F790B1|nr:MULTISPECIES: GAF domain-containing protein [unclassified Nocardioides]KQW53039.1 histidine kinase [Nocardioides sp. Root1257]KRC55727.1 histidine kinase [Nocardioides sp. Root224]